MRSRGPVGVVLIAGALLAGCGGGGGGSASPEPTSAAPSSSGGSAPRVSDPIDSSALASPCSALTSSQLTELGLGQGTSRQAAGGPTCFWRYTDNNSDRVDLGSISQNKNGLSDVYDQKSKYEYFEETEVAGYPAVYASQADQRTEGECNLLVGVNDQLAVQVTSQFNARNPRAPQSCQYVEQVAEAAIATLKG